MSISKSGEHMNEKFKKTMHEIVARVRRSTDRDLQGLGEALHSWLKRRNAT